MPGARDITCHGCTGKFEELLAFIRHFTEMHMVQEWVCRKCGFVSSREMVALVHDFSHRHD